MRRVAEGMYSGISAAGDSKPDRLNRVQPHGSLLRGHSADNQPVTAKATVRETVLGVRVGTGATGGFTLSESVIAITER